MIWEMCHVKRGGIQLPILIIVYLLQQKTMASQNYNISLNIVNLPTNLQIVIPTSNVNISISKKNINLKNIFKIKNNFVFTKIFNLHLKQCFLSSTHIDPIILLNSFPNFVM